MPFSAVLSPLPLEEIHQSFQLFKKNVYSFLAVLGFVAVCHISLVAASRGYSLVVVCRLLTATASPVVVHRL